MREIPIRRAKAIEVIIGGIFHLDNDALGRFATKIAQDVGEYNAEITVCGDDELNKEYEITSLLMK